MTRRETHAQRYSGYTSAVNTSASPPPMRLLQHSSDGTMSKDKSSNDRTRMANYRGYAVPQNLDFIWGDERFSTLKSPKTAMLNGSASSQSSPNGYHLDLNSGPRLQNGHAGTGIVHASREAPQTEADSNATVVRKYPTMRELKGSGLSRSLDASTGREMQVMTNGGGTHNTSHRHDRMDQLVAGRPCMQSPTMPGLRSPENNNSKSHHMWGPETSADARWLAKEAMKTRAVSLDMGYQAARIWTPGHTPPSSGSGTPTKEKVLSLPEEVQRGSRSSRPNQLKIVHQTNGHALQCNGGSVCQYTPPSTPTSPTSDSSKKSLNRSQGLETITEITTRSNTSWTSSTLLKRSAKSDSDVLPFRRTNSTPNCLDDLGCTSDNDDDDDYGFLSYYWARLSSSYPSASSPRSTSSSAAMQKAKSPSQAHRILLPKKWRKPKLLSSSNRFGAGLWKQETPCTWSSAGGRRVTLTGTTLASLTEAEKLAAQKMALAKLQGMNLGCSINIPKDWNKRSKKSGFSLKRRTVSSSILDNFKDKGKDKENRDGGGWVFSIPLGKVVANDVELRRRRTSLLRERRDSLDMPQVHRAATRKSSSSSGGAVSSDSLSESDGRGAGTNLLDALSLLPSSKLENTHKDRHDHPGTTSYAQHCRHSPQVPYIVNCCVKHLETYGLRVLGIFRIGSSKKRIRQLREDFDSGKDVRLNEEHNTHDVGAVLKEFFRDLSDPLLCRDLYSAFVATRKLSSQEKRLHALHLLVSLLPATHIDTLWALLAFLKTVVEHSVDEVDEHGQELAGNKMNSHNLATLFGPNILHKSKGGEFQVESLERADDRQDVISVVEDLIDHHRRIFEVSAQTHDEVVQLLMETNPETADSLLNLKSNFLTMDMDPESSSSVYEESDSSSLPHSPSYSSEMDSGQPRSLQEALALQQQQLLDSHRHKSAEHEPMRKTASANRLAAPDPVWYRADRSKSPASPRISPSPKAMKAGPNLHIRITAESPERTMVVDSGLGSVTPRTRSRNTDCGRSQSSGSHMLTVPSSRSKNRDSNSSLSSGYMAGSSRSGTNSPSPPAMTQGPAMIQGSKWYLETPPESPAQDQLDPRDRDLRGASPCPFQRTSSTHRPLGINVHSQSTGQLSPSRSSDDCPHEWQKDRWHHWEKLAKEHSDEFHEQETLV